MLHKSHARIICYVVSLSRIIECLEGASILNKLLLIVSVVYKRNIITWLYDNLYIKKNELISDTEDIGD